VVVPALAGTVVVDLHAAHGGECGGRVDVVAAEEIRVLACAAALAFADIHAGRATRKGGNVELAPVDGTGRYRRILRQEDLCERRSVVDGAPDALLERVHVNVAGML